MTYKRNASAILSAIKENQAGQVIAMEPCRIQVPVRFSEIGLGEIGINIFTYGMFALILGDDQYSVMNVTAMVELQPYKFNIVTIDEVDYHEFHFDKGDVIIKTTDLIVKEIMLFNVFDEFIFKGKVPWYCGYEDLGKLFDTARHHAGSRVGDVPEVNEFIASMITRSNQDRSKYIREVGNTDGDFSTDKIDYVPLKSVFYSVKSTVNKLTGSYFADGITSALVNKTTKVDRIESVLRA